MTPAQTKQVFVSFTIFLTSFRVLGETFQKASPVGVAKIMAFVAHDESGLSSTSFSGANVGDSKLEKAKNFFWIPVLC